MQQLNSAQKTASVVMTASVVFLAIAIFACCAGVVFRGGGHQQQAAQKVERPNRGEQGRVTSAGVGSAPAALSYDLWKRSSDLILARDKLGHDQMVARGQVAWLPDGTTVQMIDPGVMCSEVRVLDGPWRGTAMFIDAHFVAK